MVANLTSAVPLIAISLVLLVAILWFSSGS